MSPSPLYVEFVTDALLAIVAALITVSTLTARATTRIQKRINEQLDEHRREHAAAAADARGGRPNLSFRCPACGLAGYGSTNAPADLEIGMPCPVCGVQVELLRMAPDVT